MLLSCAASSIVPIVSNIWQSYARDFDETTKNNKKKKRHTAKKNSSTLTMLMHDVFCYFFFFTFHSVSLPLNCVCGGFSWSAILPLFGSIYLVCSATATCSGQHLVYCWFVGWKRVQLLYLKLFFISSIKYIFRNLFFKNFMCVGNVIKVV